MFLIKNVGKALFGSENKQEIIQIDSGQLYLVRPRSPKGLSECIFKDATACIRRTSTPFNYQLVIQRMYEEGEEQYADDADDDDEGNDEKTFLLDESLQFRATSKDGQSIFAWRDLQGDHGDLYEFVCDTSTQSSTVHGFEVAALNCQFERKYGKSHANAKESELEQFLFTASPIIPASPVEELPSRQSLTKERQPSQQGIPTTPVANSSKKKASKFSQSTPKGQTSPDVMDVMDVPMAMEAPVGGEILAEERCELHLFDVNSGHFVLQDDEVTAAVVDMGGWNYWLKIENGSKPWLAQQVVTDISPVFSFDYLSFIFNAYTDDNTAYSWLLRFKDMPKLERFQEGLMRALWEHLNEMKWLKAKTDERDYILEAFQDISMDDVPEEDEEEDEERYDSGGDDSNSDEDEEEDTTAAFARSDEDGGENSQLAVGYKHDRSYVVRGSKIGVFKHLADDTLEFSTTINKVRTPKGKVFEPSKVMLHTEDSSMILQNRSDSNSLFRLDIETGKVVDEWKIHDDIPIVNFTPENKFAQTTSEPTFIGHSRNALYRVDPRLSGHKLVDSELKQYMTKNDFSAAATTEKGYIAVASNKGDIRLFDRLGINAKTHLPALGEPILGIDVSADGRWILATCRTYLLLVDAQQSEGKFAGKLGFERSFGKDNKPKPRRLALTPSHVAQFQQETKAPISFTTAKFNTGLDASETSIITSTGPFIITWNMRKVLKGVKDGYQIKRYAENIKADNFKFGSDKNVIVALPDAVDMVAKGTFKKPTRESISTPVKQLRSRSSIVNSPY